MPQKSTQECIDALIEDNQLLVIKEEVDPYLEMAEIQRRIYAQNGPAILFEKIKGCDFKAISNIYGSLDRTDYIFGKSVKRTKLAMEAWANPMAVIKKPWQWLDIAWAGINSLPKKISIRHKDNPKKIPVMECQCKISDLPPIHSWPLDGGAFVTLPQVLSRDPDDSGIMKTNIGMYRIQMTGNEYKLDEEVGLHYQIHRGIGIHHTKALAQRKDLKVSVFVGGPPSHAVAAMMPTPEGMSEALFAGMLGGRRFRYTEEDGWLISTEADFCILGTIASDLKPEGPFGDHLGYHSLEHLFPYLKVEKVYHRKDAVWPFTVVGRPPQEDTSFGQLVHSLTGNIISTQIPGVNSLHAVDAAGVHSLLLAVGSERYVPYERREPREILTQANTLLGFNQVSLTKYLFICAQEDNPNLKSSDVEKFFEHVLERANWSRDLHFQTSTTMDTLDYTGTSLNKGSKLVIAAAGKPCRKLARDLPKFKSPIPSPYSEARLVMNGVMIVNCSKFKSYKDTISEIDILDQWAQSEDNSLSEIAWIVIVDDVNFCKLNMDNFVWVTFLRSNPSHDTYGVNASTDYKHWGCQGPLITDARIKPHHAPGLETTEKAKQRATEILNSTVKV